MENTKTLPTYAELTDLPQFTLDEDRLREAIAHEATDPDDERNDVYPLDEIWGDVDADSIHKLIDQARECGALECPEGWEIVVYPTAASLDSDGVVITIWSTRVDPSSQVVAMSTGLSDLASQEAWENEEDGTERTVQAAAHVTQLANSSAYQLTGAEAETRKLARLRRERADGHGHWLLVNELATENNTGSFRTKLEECQQFDTSAEAVKACEGLIDHFHTATINDNLAADVPIDLGVGDFITATQRLEAFRRAESDEWTLFEDGSTARLTFVDLPTE